MKRIEFDRIPQTLRQWERLRKMNARGRWPNPPRRERRHFALHVATDGDFALCRARHVWRTGRPAVTVTIPQGATLREVEDAFERLLSFLTNYWKTVLVEPHYISRLDAARRKGQDL